MIAVTLLDDLTRTADEHFRLHVYAAVLRLRARLPEPDDDNGLAFLGGYHAMLDRAGFSSAGTQADERFAELIAGWEDTARDHLPLHALRETCGLDADALTLLFVAGLVEEDPRFGPVFEALNGLAGELRPTAGLLSTWSADDRARRHVHALLAAGLLTPGPAATPRSRWALQIPDVLWDAMRGGVVTTPAPWARYRPPEQLKPASELVLAQDTAQALARLPGILPDSQQLPVIVRGPHGSGRGAVLGALAHTLGRGVLELTADAPASLAGPLATLLDAVPVVELQPAPGATAEVPQLGAYVGPVGVVLGRRGGVRAPERGLTLTLGVPDVADRAVHWAQGLGGDGDIADRLAARFRTPGGTIRSAAGLAHAEAALRGSTRPDDGDVMRAMRILHSEAFDTLATRLTAVGGWHDLAVGDETACELELLENRCRHRERLHETVGATLAAQLTPGVRALLSGPSGTGKTLAARLLASVLGKELYALDLSTVVSKYIGETEKNLDVLFSRAEELDVILLLDEGDALLTRRTAVQSSNDRYANLETNFLLQRLESYEGILLVTTNAGDRIDGAFRRRMDIVVDFRAPEAAERWTIWQLHLAGDHALDDVFLDELSGRCQLTGGQIRNAVLHASLLALHEGVPLDRQHAELAVRREYRKAGAICPLRPRAVARG
jgi:hypothetical protein